MSAGRTIQITAAAVSAEATFNDSRTARAIWDALPIDAKAETWGDEVYFGIGLALGAPLRPARATRSAPTAR